MIKQVYFIDLGSSYLYKEIWDYQESLLQQNVGAKTKAREADAQRPEPLTVGSHTDVDQQQSTVNCFKTTNYLLFAEHAAVYTLGKSGDISHVLISNKELEEKGIEFFRINRGGDITFHGPGQLVGYPILDLEQFNTDLGWYLRNLEEVIILTMAEFGLKGERSKGETGVWMEPNIKGRERKICAMGIRCSRWITMHGFAFNVNTDLTYFSYIVPCGIENKQVTSLEKELGRPVDLNEVKQKLKRNFESVFGVTIKDAVGATLL